VFMAALNADGGFVLGREDGPRFRANADSCGETFGNEKILALGLCATCYTLKRQDAEYFGGLREQVLERDGYACRVCGDPDPGVHHREPGKSRLHLMIALCGGCHSKVHRTKVVLTEFPPLLLVLWREQHPEGHEQAYVDFDVRKPPAQSVPPIQAVFSEFVIERELKSSRG
jgi:hypothetical protein